MALPASQPTPDDQLVNASEFEAELFWYKHRQSLLVLAALIAICAVITAGWFINAHNTRLAAETLFAQSHDAAGWREVVAKYPSSMPAANAYFLLANSLREQRQYDESTATFQKFLDTFPNHPLVGGALLGIAENLEVQGKDADALQSLRDLQVRASGSYAAPFAEFIEARIFLNQGKADEAQKVLVGLLQTYPNSAVAEFAGPLKDEIDVLLPPDLRPGIQ